MTKKLVVLAVTCCCFLLTGEPVQAQYAGYPGFGYSGSADLYGSCGRLPDPRLGYCLENDCFCGGGYGGYGGCGQSGYGGCGYGGCGQASCGHGGCGHAGCGGYGYAAPGYAAPGYAAPGYGGPVIVNLRRNADGEVIVEALYQRADGTMVRGPVPPYVRVNTGDQIIGNTPTAGGSQPRETIQPRVPSVRSTPPRTRTRQAGYRYRF